MEKVSVPLPSSLYFSIYQRFGEASTEAILEALTKLAGSDQEVSGPGNNVPPRPGAGTVTGKVWEIADRFSSKDVRATRQKVVDACVVEGINVNTANTQYSHWSKAPLQGSGVMYAWQSPDRQFHRLFLALDLECKPDHYPGIVIITDRNHNNVLVSEVQNLEKELPSLLATFGEEPLVYWDLETNPERRRELLSRLTAHPIFVG